MSDQQPSGGNRPNNSNPGSANSNSNNNNNRRHLNNNQRRRPAGPNNQQGPNQAPRPAGGSNAQAQGANSNPNRGQGGGGNRRRRPHSNNRPRNPNPNNPSNQNNNAPMGINIERIYEKYLNLLDQHLIARRKYHDLFYRADPAQKNKLERNFYNTLNDIRDFESKLAPEARELFEKRNNGLRPDNIYTTNHEIPDLGDNPPPETEWIDPHFLQSQKLAEFAADKEESMGTLDDYLRYKNLL